MISVKAVISESEIRRFSASNFEEFVENLKGYGVEFEELGGVFYLDDENDYVRLTASDEWSEAVKHREGKVLKICLVPPTQKLPVNKPESNVYQPPPFEPPPPGGYGRGRGWHRRGRGRGRWRGRGRGRGKRVDCSPRKMPVFRKLGRLRKKMWKLEGKLKRIRLKELRDVQRLELKIEQCEDEVVEERLKKRLENLRKIKIMHEESILEALEIVKRDIALLEEELNPSENSVLEEEEEGEKKDMETREEQESEEGEEVVGMMVPMDFQGQQENPQPVYEKVYDAFSYEE